ncbi:MAG: hypothetical protein M1358_11850, partial [Chloroflexi bacterium]|nr:hypothetical protein [Chloroflexota bacterium]
RERDDFGVYAVGESRPRRDRSQVSVQLNHVSALYPPIVAHQTLGSDEFIMVVVKQNVQSLSRTANCKWLSEIAHEDPLWINREVADQRGIKRGDMVKLNTNLGSITARAALTHGIHPKVVAIAGSGGHWEYGRIAQAKKFQSNDPDTKLLWWEKSGSVSANPNQIVPIAMDTVTKQQAWKDTVVKMSRV